MIAYSTYFSKRNNLFQQKWNYTEICLNVESIEQH